MPYGMCPCRWQTSDRIHIKSLAKPHLEGWSDLKLPSPISSYVKESCIQPWVEGEEVEEMAVETPGT